MLWEGVRFVVISECFTEFSPHVTLFCCFYVEKWVVAGRRLRRCLPSVCMSKHEQHFAQEQRGTDGRVKEHKRQRRQILCLSLCLSLSLSLSLSRSLSFFLSLSMLLSPYFFLFGLTSFLMRNTLILHVSCVYFLSSCSLLCVSSYGLGTYMGHPTAPRSHVACNQLHSRKMPASSDSTHDCLFAVLAWGLTPQQAGTHVPTSNYF